MTRRFKANAVPDAVLGHQDDQDQVANGDQLSASEAQAIWDEGAAFIGRKDRAIAWLIVLTRTFSEQIRTRPHELELKELLFELQQIEIPGAGGSQPYAQAQQRWHTVFESLEDLRQRYRELSSNWLPAVVPDSEPPISRREMVRLLEQMGWKGKPDAYLKQANKDKELKSCQSEQGRGWRASQLIDLGIRRGKLEPKIHKAKAAMGSWVFGPR